MRGAGNRHPLDRSFIYVLGCQGTRYAKIGVTNRPSRRLKSIQANCPHRLIQLRLFEAHAVEFREKSSFSLEGSLHAALKACHVHGEWFQLSDADLTTIDSMAEEAGFTKVFSGKSDVPLLRNASAGGLVNRLPKTRTLNTPQEATEKEVRLDLLREAQSMLQKHAAGTRRMNREEHAYVRNIIAFAEEAHAYPKFIAHLKELL